MATVMEKEIELLIVGEDCPFEDWFDELDVAMQAVVLKRLDRVRKGNFGDYDHVGNSVLELRIHNGPGYRIYFAEEERRIVILLCAGSKRTQKKDIKTAKELLGEYEKGANEEVQFVSTKSFKGP